jgi:uroporphyrinogen-III synthase
MRTLYLGLELPSNAPQLVHYPVIAIQPLTPKNLETLLKCTHTIFTSKTAARLLSTLCPESLANPVIAVGKATAKAAEVCGYTVPWVAQEETAEGVVALLDTIDLSQAHLFWPHSAKARPVIAHYLHNRSIPLTESVLYDITLIRPEPVPSLHDFHEVIFTSPSTVDGFLRIFPSVPPHLKLTCIGPITQSYLKRRFIDLV